ncbi:TetR/AcrR family transcriptional regulator [Actinoplanes sichuanensis]|nr:TetR/AcrR family transcriptional regulator [Actinoplanes sichuanensis]
MLTAALDLLLSEGPTALTAQRLFQVTGVSRSTVYRHWPTPAAVLAALIDVAPIPAEAPSGDLAKDLHAEVDRLCDRLRDRPVGAFLQALVVAAETDLRHRYVSDLLAPFHEVLRAAGVPDDEREDGVAMIASPLLLDALLLDRTAARDRAHRIADTFTASRSRK